MSSVFALQKSYSFELHFIKKYVNSKYIGLQKCKTTEEFRNPKNNRNKTVRALQEKTE